MTSLTIEVPVWFLVASLGVFVVVVAATIVSANHALSRLYLQIEHDGDPLDAPDWMHCTDRINDGDVEYVRMAEAKALITASRAVQRVLCATCSIHHGGGCPGHCDEIVALDAAIRGIEEKS